MIRPFETATDVTLDVMLEMSLLKLDMTEEQKIHDTIIMDIGYCVVEQLIRLKELQ